MDVARKHFCPVSGLLVTILKEWQGQNLDDAYTANFSLIGKSTVYSLPAGSVTLQGLRSSVGLLDKISGNVSNGDNRYILIEDASRLKSTTIEARKYFIDYLIDNERVLSLIFCNVSPLFRVGIRIGQRFNTTSREIFIADDYTEAIKLAMRLCDKHGLPDGEFVFGEKIRFHTVGRSLSPIEILEKKEWDIQRPDYSNRSVVIDGNIMHSVSAGHLREEYLELIYRVREDVMKTIPQKPGIEYILVDVNNFEGGGLRVRQEYMQSLEEWHKKKPLRMYVFYGANRFMQTAAVIAKSFMPFQVKLAENLDHAFDLIGRDKQGRHITMGGESRPDAAEPPMEKDVENLLAFIGRIDWEREGLAGSLNIDENHPFYIIYRAINLIKEELDDLIRERKDKEAALLKSEEKYRELFEKGSDILCFHDFEGNIIETNLAFKKDYGWHENHPIPLTVRQIIPERYRAQHDEYLARIRQNGEDKGLLRVSTRVGREIVLEYDSVLVKNADGEPLGVKVSARDVTERIHAAKENKRLQENLRQAQKMEAIGTLAGGIAHDFNNILGIILGSTELALSEIPKQHSVHYNLEVVKMASLRAKDVINQLLSFSRNTHMKKRPINILPIIKESIKLLRASIPSSIDIRLDTPRELRTINADPVQIHQILINLCTNAAQAMQDKGGILEIRLQEITRPESSIIPTNGKPPKHFVQMTVSDTGEGIDPRIIDRIFDPYFTTKDVGRGSGMGLSVVHGIVRNYSGEISVSSKLRKGTTVKVILPVNESKPKTVDSDDKEPLRGGNESILIVDDEKLLAESIRKLLEQLGYKAEVSTNPEEALSLFSLYSSQFDLVITDMTMPVMNGDVLAKEIWKIRPAMPIILCTGFSEKIDGVRSAGLGIRKYILKPVDRNELARSVRDALDGV